MTNRYFTSLFNIRSKASPTFWIGITSDIELIRIQQINEAYERLLKSDVKYRFVIDAASLRT